MLVEIAKKEKEDAEEAISRLNGVELQGRDLEVRLDAKARQFLCSLCDVEWNGYCFGVTTRDDGSNVSNLLGFSVGASHHTIRVSRTRLALTMRQ